MHLTFFSCNTFAKTITNKLIENLIKSHGIQYNIASDH